MLRRRRKPRYLRNFIVSAERYGDVSSSSWGPTIWARNRFTVQFQVLYSGFVLNGLEFVLMRRNRRVFLVGFLFPWYKRKVRRMFVNFWASNA